jgi:hypothetical protein
LLAISACKSWVGHLSKIEVISISHKYRSWALVGSYLFCSIVTEQMMDKRHDSPLFFAIIGWIWFSSAIIRLYRWNIKNFGKRLDVSGSWTLFIASLLWLKIRWKAQWGHWLLKHPYYWWEWNRHLPTVVLEQC